ncbi:probable leucine-rich repeat receptor-like serine/threonine-protein kinase At3g14840 isoform X4 [Rhododendron vialii]|uniref:probable leucine-rich repeat receptor-like serine/threonine-protein kinase At3g14840 isoform X4 n=2 Tax=Rhododendron vialii TaxID=182163 RepID=UPI00265EF37E|nr:probable leucine-rich repeat receptor-like serine/threonine-protein kinase At3g14840 isoform X4 [Rhododendron vialii]
MRIFPRNFASLAIGILFISFTTLASAATLLPPDEVEALKEIGKTLGKTDWNFSGDPCTTFSTVTVEPILLFGVSVGFENSVNCTCYGTTVCHITRIALKAQDLQGTLPPELVRLTRLEDIDLTRNYLSGTIPLEWGSMMELKKISLLGNRITGRIPKELANINTLAIITVEFNQLSGPIPPKLGSLPHLEQLHLTSNYFTGELPKELANLTTLKEFLIGSNYFTGKIPDFIQNWTNLEKLGIVGSGLDGPIPPSIGLLTKLSELRISDLNGSQASFPPLNNLIRLEALILRSCNINGTLPEYLGTMTNLTLLDLSFNNLSGKIPSNFSSLSKISMIYLTGNLLSGPVPPWMLQSTSISIDLSYNNFDLGSSQDYQQGRTNLFGSSSKGNFSGNVPCLSLRGFRCNQKWSSFHINCGGKEVSLDGKKYEGDDEDPGVPSKFYRSATNWEFSNTGHFLDQKHPLEAFISTNSSRLYMNNSDLYMDARISPISLTYYGSCLVKGNYKITLHFAEIMFNDSKSYGNLGRRIFDIYIQEKLVQKDFNIVDEAGGIGKEIKKNYTEVVTDGTLEIRLYWAGKGTTGLPFRGVYGPLISAISVDNPDYKPPPKGISAGAVVGIVAAAAFVIILLLGILWWRGFLIRKDTMDQDLKGLDLQTGSFTLRQIKAATDNFDEANKIGEGGFGSVYKGLLSDGTVIAVKQLSSKSKQGNREFVNEIGMISALQHPHLVKLYGCCIEGNQLLLVYEYMENNSLARALFGPEECQLQLDWPTRYKICIGIARGLAYLHEESRLKIVHRDIKATNVLLDKNLNPKISDFGLAKLDEEDDTHISTRIAGTYGYMAPEYAMRGYLTDKADVYSFEIVALEIVSGRSNTSYRTKEYCLYLLDWALILKQKGNMMELVDPKLGSDFNKIEVTVMINVALMCTNMSPAVRPAMSSVVSMLEGRTVPETSSIPDPDASNEQMKLKGMMIELQKSLETDTSEGQIQIVPPDGPYTASASAGDLYPYTASSASAGDLYPLNWDSQVMENQYIR